MTQSIVTELIIQEMKRDPNFRFDMVNEGMFGDLFKAVKNKVMGNEELTLEQIFTKVASQATKLEKTLEAIMKKVASTGSSKSESATNRRVEYLLRNLNEGPEQLNEIALTALMAMASAAAVKWGVAMGLAKTSQWIRSIAQWVAKYMKKIPDDEYADLTDQMLRTRKNAEEDEGIMHHVHHSLDEQASSDNKVLAFFARWKRVEHFIEKVLDAPFQGIATMLVYISGGDPKGNDAWFVKDIKNYIKTLFLLMLLCQAVVHMVHIFKHLDFSSMKELISSIKHVLTEAEETTTIFETEGATAGEGIITILSHWTKDKVKALKELYGKYKSFEKSTMIAIQKNMAMTASTSTVSLSTEAIDRIHMHANLILENRNAKLKRRTRKKSKKSRPSRE